MTLVRKLKALYKAAVRSGKIVYLGPKHKFQHDEDFTLFRKKLAPIEWKQFEEREFLFGKHIASKKVNYEAFHCKDDIEQWFRLIKVLVGIFYKDGIFLRLKPSGKRWNEAFLRLRSHCIIFCMRVYARATFRHTDPLECSDCKIFACEQKLAHAKKLVG